MLPKTQKIRKALNQAFQGKDVVFVTPTQMRASHLAYEIENVLLGAKELYSPYRIFEGSRKIEVGEGTVKVYASTDAKRLAGTRADVRILDEGDILREELL